MLRQAIKLLRSNKRGISTVIVVMLSLALLVTVVGNLVIWSYQMNEMDRERIQESITINSAKQTEKGIALEIKNNGPEGAQIVALWIVDSNNHERFEVDLFVNSGENAQFVLSDIKLPESYTLIRIVTNKGNAAVLSS